MEIKNPIPIVKIGDPYVLNYNGVYYLYATSSIRGYYCWKSENLATWSEPWVCFEPKENSFGSDCFWAPEVYEFNGKFYMYYTAQWKIYEKEELRIGVAVANSPEGPFEDVLDNRPMFDFGYGVLDAHVLKDGDRNYLYYSRAGSKSLGGWSQGSRNLRGRTGKRLHICNRGRKADSETGTGVGEKTAGIKSILE